MIRRLLAAALLLLVVSTTAAAQQPPNILFILTDDLSPRLMPYLPRLREMLAEPGLELGMVATTPVCAPSRVSMLTGQYAHNHGITGNFLKPFHARGGEYETFATWLQRAGYTTGYFGKYVNGYGGNLSYVPPGWDRWTSGIRMLHRADYHVLRENGEVSHVQRVYDVDLFAIETARFLASAPEPFLAVWAPLAPHGPFASAKRHRGRFDDLEIKWPPSFSADRDEVGKLVRTRLEMMLAVEEGVEMLLDVLRERGVLDRTYVFFTTDNGVFMGEHGLDAGKGQPYEEASRIPLYVRGPGVRKGRSDALVASQDIAPTFAELAGVPVPDSVDGRSMVPLLSAEPEMPWRDRLLLEFWALQKHLVWKGLRTNDVKYARWNDGPCMVFDLIRDPDEMHPRPCGPEDEVYAQTVKKMSRCRGRACSLLEGGLVGSAAALEQGLDVERAVCAEPALIAAPRATRAPTLLPAASPPS